MLIINRFSVDLLHTVNRSLYLQLSLAAAASLLCIQLSNAFYILVLFHFLALISLADSFCLRISWPSFLSNLVFCIDSIPEF